MSTTLVEFVFRSSSSLIQRNSRLEGWYRLIVSSLLHREPIEGLDIHLFRHHPVLGPSHSSRQSRPQLFTSSSSLPRAVDQEEISTLASRKAYPAWPLLRLVVRILLRPLGRVVRRSSVSSINSHQTTGPAHEQTLLGLSPYTACRHGDRQRLDFQCKAAPIEFRSAKLSHMEVRIPFFL